MSKENLFAKAIAGRKKSIDSETPEDPEVIAASAPVESTLIPQAEADLGTTPNSEAVASNGIAQSIVAEGLPANKRGRGRPATGKRSNDDWIGRTYYVKRDTDLDAEEQLLRLKRQGIELDKSELVDFLLSAWVSWQQGENIDFRLSEITPRRKSENSSS